VGIAADQGLVADPGALVAAFQEELRALARLAPAAAPGVGAADPAATPHVHA
jgi:hypothetical protein